MATTYKLISSNTLTSSAASVTFSSIPSTYTDLVLRISARTDEAVADSSFSIRFNNDSSSNYSYTRIRSTGSVVSSARLSNTTSLQGFSGAVGSTATSNTFSNSEIYIPSYTVSQNKPVSIFDVLENNSSSAYMFLVAGLWRNTNAINQITCYGIPGPSNFVSGSSFYLYGIASS